MEGLEKLEESLLFPGSSIRTKARFAVVNSFVGFVNLNSLQAFW
jgi:hypothetical protein